MTYNPIPTLNPVPRYPTRSDGERLDELMQAALNGGSDMVVALNKDFIPSVNAVIPALNTAMPNLAAIVAAPEKANQAAASATAAAGSASSASGSATTATNAKTAAEAAKTAAQGSATSAAGSATTANTKAGEASASATSASGSAATATTAKNAAELAKTQAEAAKTAAQGSATAAAGSATTANTAKTAAETAKIAAQTAESNALASKNAASASATNAATSETNANASKNAAAGSATAANTAKTAAEAANTAAQTAKTGAETAKTQADAAKTAAAGSATAAKASETESAAILKKVEDAEIGVFPPATLATAGVVKLSPAIGSESVTEAATPIAVKKAYDLAHQGGKQYFVGCRESLGTGWIKFASASTAGYNSTLSVSMYVASTAVGAGTIYGSAVLTSTIRRVVNPVDMPIGMEFECLCCDSAFDPKRFKMLAWHDENKTTVELWVHATQRYTGWVVKPLTVEREGADGHTAWTFHEFNGTHVDPLPTDAQYELPCTIGHLTDELNVMSSSIGASATAVQKAADIAKAAKVSSESWTLTAAVPANGQITLPRGYIVGAKEMMLFKGGMLVNYADIGTPGKWSTVCKLTGAAASGDVLTMVGPLETAPSVVLDFEGGAWPKELVCTRATVDYVFDDNGKVQEVPANTPAITKDPVTGRKGLQVFGQRTRLNKYYRNIQGNLWGDNNNGFETDLVRIISDTSSPTGSATRLEFASSRCTRNDSSYIQYDIQRDTGVTAVTKDTLYSFSVCLKASKNMTVAVYSYTKNAAGAYQPSVLAERIYATTSYVLHTFTVTVKSGEYISILPRFTYQPDIPHEDKTDGYIDIAYLQIEESAVPTPLIAGPEGQQVTVGDTMVLFGNGEKYSNPVIVTHSDTRREKIIREYALLGFYDEVYKAYNVQYAISSIPMQSEFYYRAYAKAMLNGSTSALISFDGTSHNEHVIALKVKPGDGSYCMWFDGYSMCKQSPLLPQLSNKVRFASHGKYSYSNLYNVMMFDYDMSDSELSALTAITEE